MFARRPGRPRFSRRQGIALCLQGWAYCPGKIIKRLYVLDGATRHKVHNHSWPRADVLDYFYPAKDPDGESLGVT